LDDVRTIIAVPISRSGQPGDGRGHDGDQCDADAALSTQLARISWAGQVDVEPAEQSAPAVISVSRAVAGRPRADRP